MNYWFIDPKREKKRIEKGRSRIADVFWYSSVDDYPRLRFAVNTLIGLLVCTAAYYMVCRRLNFLEFNVYAALSFQLAFIFGATWTFASSPAFRCAVICVCLGALGRNGQGLFSLFVVERLTDGPVENIVYNFQLSSSIVICHLEIQSRIAAKRVALAVGPVEALLEQQLGNSVTIGRKIVHSLKALLGSYGADLRTSSDEDDAMASVIDHAQALSDRQFLVEGGGVLVNATTTVEPMTTITFMNIHDHNNETTLSDEQRPAWARYKTAMARAVAHRFVRRCETMYATAVKTCHERLENMQSLCYDKTPTIIAFFTCRRMNALELCQPGTITSMAERHCERGTNVEGNGTAGFLLSSDLDAQMAEVQNVSQEITDQLKLNLHFQAIEEPAREHIRALDEIRAEIQSDVLVFRTVLNTIEDLLSAVLILLLYWIFRDVATMIDAYLNDLDYRNQFLTVDFHYVDAERRRRGRTNFVDRPLTVEERKHHELMTPFSWPTRAEVIANWQPFLRWLVLVAVVMVILALDHFLYRVLALVVRFGASASTSASKANSDGNSTAHAAFGGEHTLQIAVKGEGPIAEMIRDILKFRFTTKMHEELYNEMCLTRPRPPDWPAAVVWLAVPLVVMLVLQLAFSFLISRISVLYVMAFVFRRRARERAKHLYRRLLTHREGQSKRAERLGLVLLSPEPLDSEAMTPDYRQEKLEMKTKL